MRTLLAALDNSAAARPVLDAALIIARLFGATVDALHVREDGDATARAAAEAAGVRIRTVEDPTVPSLVREAQARQVKGIVLGVRGTPLGPHPAGQTAVGVINRLEKPVIVVPPDLPIPYRLRRVLVPLDATPATAAALRSTIELACAGDLAVVVLHVYTHTSMPLFTDQPHHETEAWTQEFMARYCPRELRDRIQVELRIGRPGEHVLGVAAEVNADLITLGWAQDLSPGRADVVREVLRRSRVPVLLTPVDRSADSALRSSQPLGATDDPPDLLEDHPDRAGHAA